LIFIIIPYILYELYRWGTYLSTFILILKLKLNNNNSYKIYSYYSIQCTTISQYSIEALKTSYRGCILLVPTCIFMTIVFVVILNFNNYGGGGGAMIIFRTPTTKTVGKFYHSRFFNERKSAACTQEQKKAVIIKPPSLPLLHQPLFPHLYRKTHWVVWVRITHDLTNAVCFWVWTKYEMIIIIIITTKKKTKNRSLKQRFGRLYRCIIRRYNDYIYGG